MRAASRFWATPLLVAVAIAATLATGPLPAAAADSYLYGIDVSHWQGAPRWRKVKNAGVRFVIARATYGNTGLDTEYDRNSRLLRKQRIPFAAYHHADPDLSAGDAIAEADHFVDVAQMNGRNLLPALDLKIHGELDQDQLQEWVKTWCARVEERLGVKPMIYAPNRLWVNWMNDTTWFADNGYLFWVQGLDLEIPAPPANDWGGHGWTLWQYDIGRVPGISTRVDQNYFKGTVLAPIRIKNNR